MRILHTIFVAVFIFLFSATAKADDDAICANGSPVSARTTACTRLIENSGRQGRALAILYFDRGNSLLEAGDAGRAIADYNEAIKLDPTYAANYNNRGRAWEKLNDIDRAIADYTEAIRIDPKHINSVFSRGRLWHRKGDNERALVDLNRTIDLDAKFAAAHFERGNVWYDRHDLVRAISDYDEAISLKPDYAVAYMMRGDVRRFQKNYDQALLDFNKAIQLDAKLSKAYFGRAYSLRIKGDNENALKDYNEAIRLRPDDPLAYNNRAVILRSKGDYDRALSDYNNALRLDPNYALALTGRGIAYEAKGELDLARADYNAALALAPKHETGNWSHDTARARLAIIGLGSSGRAVSTAPNKRIAIVIGNGAYKNVTQLPNPPNDARAIAAVLRQIGFTVIDAYNVDHNTMQRVVADFLSKVTTANVAIVYYAGHGVSIDGRNYLVPIDAKLETKMTAGFELIDVDQILAPLDDEARSNIIILDACRNNPLASKISGTRAIDRGTGLAAYSNVASGMLIAFATAPGQVAEDGSGAHSPFTTALLKHIPTANVEINEMFRRVRVDVVKETERKQVPWVNSSLLGEIYLRGDQKQTLEKK